MSHHIPGTIIGNVQVFKNAELAQVACDSIGSGLDLPDRAVVEPYGQGFAVRVYLDGDEIGDLWND